MLNYILARAAEPSTWAGVAALLAAAHIAVPTDIWANTVPILTGLAGIAAILIKERDAPQAV